MSARFALRLSFALRRQCANTYQPAGDGRPGGASAQMRPPATWLQARSQQPGTHAEMDVMEHDTRRSPHHTPGRRTKTPPQRDAYSPAARDRAARSSWPVERSQIAWHAKHLG